MVGISNFTTAPSIHHHQTHS